MPTYNPDLGFLKLAVKSVLAQTYQYWELCIADDASSDSGVRGLLQSLSFQDARIKVTYRLRNGHISEASNSALELATGGWVALMDHDDLLSPTALHEVAAAIRANQRTRLIYSDEDKIDESSKRHDPYYKPSWNRDLFYSQNFISHLGVYQKEILNNIGGFRKGLEGAQDHDLALRFIEQIGDDQIHHIPQVLYHWRAHSRSTASALEAKPYAVTAGERAINDHLKKAGRSGHCTHDGEGGYRIRYPMPERNVALTAIILFDGNVNALRQSLDQIKRMSDEISIEIIVCPTTYIVAAMIKECRFVDGETVIYPKLGEGLSSLLNRIVKTVAGDFLWFLHDRLEAIDGEVLQELLSHAARPGIGAVGGMVLYSDGRVRQAGLLLDPYRISEPAFHRLKADSRGYMGRITLIQNYSAVSKDCMVVEKRKFLEVGGFDEGHLQTHHLDVDLCLRLKEAGYRALWTPYARFTDSRPRFTFKGVLNRFSHDYAQDRAWMQNKWGVLLKNDPAYNPNLNQKKKDFNYQWPLSDKG